MKHIQMKKDPVEYLSEGDYFGFAKAMVNVTAFCPDCGSTHIYRAGFCKDCYKRITESFDEAQPDD